MDTKFKSDPYNPINKLITSDEVLIILEKLIKELSTKGAEFMTLDEAAREFIKRDE